MEESTFTEKYLNATGAITETQLTIFLVDAASVATKAKLHEDAGEIAAALHKEGLDSWDDLHHVPVESLRNAGMRSFDATYLVRTLEKLREWAQY